MAGPSTSERAHLHALLNVRNAQVGTPVNQKGRLLVTEDENGIATAKLWANDGTLIGQLDGVLPFEVGGRGRNAWTLTGLNADGLDETWDVKAGGCGSCGGAR